MQISSTRLAIGKVNVARSSPSKSTPVEEVVAAAASVRVLRTTGAVAEPRFGCAGPHRLLYPSRADVGVNS